MHLRACHPRVAENLGPILDADAPREGVERLDLLWRRGGLALRGASSKPESLAISETFISSGSNCQTGASLPSSMGFRQLLQSGAGHSGSGCRKSCTSTYPRAPGSCASSHPAIWVSGPLRP